MNVYELLTYDIFLLLCTVILILGYMISAELSIRAWSKWYHHDAPAKRRSYFMRDQIHRLPKRW